MQKAMTENALQAIDIQLEAQAKYYEQMNAPKTRHTDQHKTVVLFKLEHCF